MSFTDNGFLLDISKQRLMPKTLDLLGNLAKERNLKQAIEDLFTGRHINWSEDRSALHTKAPFLQVDVIDTNSLLCH